MPFLVLAIGLTASLFVYLQLAATQRAREQARFESLSASTVASIEEKLRTQLTVLRGLAGLFTASDTVTADEFRAYVDRLRLRDNNPGVLGVGYAAALRSEADRVRALAMGRAAHGPEYRIWPSAGQARSTIVYLEPLDRRNREAIGFDMMSEATRRAAMSAAAAARQTRMSGRVELVQEIDSEKQAGFLIYTPVRANDQGPVTGWAYSPLRADDLFRSTVESGDQAQLSVSLYAGVPEPDNLLFHNGAPSGKRGFTVTHTLKKAGRGLTIVLATTPGFARNEPVQTAPLAGLGGALATLLLAALAWQQAVATGKVRREVNERTAELQAANQSLRDEAAARAAAEEQVRHMYRIESLGKLTGGIAHDFNNMLAVVIGNLDLAARRSGDSERVARLIEQARLGAVRAAELTQRLLVFSRQQALAPRVLDPNRLVADMSELLGRTLGEAVTLRTRLAGDLWSIEADRSQLESAILNLAVNARDAMPEGGTLTIETRNVPAAQEGAQEMVSIAVIDTGTGMSDEVRERAFDPFFTTKEVGRGTGLGLSQVFGFVRQSEGEVKIESRLGEGTAVRILLPCSKREAEDITEAEAEAGEPPKGSAEELIVVVEDEAQVRMVTVEVLRELGYTVLHAADADEALAVLERSPGARLMFTDIVMPGMNGAALAEIVRQRWPDTKILFTTGYAPEELLEGRKLGQGVALLQKPFTPDQLAFRVREVLDR